MDNNSGFSQDIEKLSEYQELNGLRRLLNLKGITSEAAIITTWFSLMKMKEELGLPSLHPIKEHYYFYQNLVEIYKIFNLSSMDFIQLNQLYIEITTYSDFLGLSETTPISEIISYIKKESLQKIASLGVRYNSLLLKVILQSNENKQDFMRVQERTPLINDIDRILFEILRSYGPLSRPELVQISGIPRSSIYDSLKRLIVRGYVVQYSEKRSHTGRPTKIFDALL